MERMTPFMVTEIDDTSIVAPPWNTFTAAKHRLASNQNTEPGLLDRLAHTGSMQVQQRVAENLGTDAETLAWLALQGSSEVRAAVAQNENALKATVIALASDLHCDVRYAMAENSRTSTELLQSLSEDQNPFVQHRARRTQSLLKAAQALSNQRGS